MLIVSIKLFCLTTYAQSLAEINAPRIVPPAPEAAALGKYGQIPIDKSTGIPNISIPLYDIKTPRFTLPISLSYHASGIKVDETATWVGMGWSLNAGGVITRSIVNLPDDMGGFYTTPLKTSAQISNTNDSVYLKSAVKQLGGYDTQPDNFFYNFNDKSGAFVFGWNTNKTPVLIPYKPLKISFNAVSGTNDTSYFKVVDESGNNYIFRTIELVSENGHPSAVSSWYLSSMISKDQSDTIKFIYQSDPLGYNQYSYTFSQNLGATINTSGCAEGDHLSVMAKTLNIRSYIRPIYIKTIVFKGGKVDFITKTGRLDSMKYALDSVIVSNYDYNAKQYHRIKSFKLNTGYFFSNLEYPAGNIFKIGSKHRLRLDSLTENDENNQGLKVHKFEYDPIQPPPVNSFAQDEWGYYNGKNQNATLLEYQQVIGGSGTVVTIGGSEAGDRSSDSAYMKAGMLEKIVYPTKGYTLISYEPHRFQSYSGTAPQTTASASSIGYPKPLDSAFFTTGTGSNTGIVEISIRQMNGIQTAVPYVKIIQVSNGTAVYSQNASQTTSYNYTTSVSLLPNTQYKLYASSPGGNDQTSWPDLPQASISITYYVSHTTIDTVNGGGLRVKSIRNYNQNGSLLTTEFYKYGSNENGAGDLMNSALALSAKSYVRTFYNLYPSMTPDSVLVHTMCNSPETIYSNNSNYSLSTLSGSPVSYHQVAVYNGDTTQNIGKVIYLYNNAADSILTVDHDYQNGVKPIPVSWKNGQIDYEAHYRRNNTNQYLLQQEKYNDYYNFYHPGAMGVYIGLRYEVIGFDPYGWPYNPYTNYIWFDYPISSGSRVPKQTRTINYANDGATILTQDTTRYYYDNLNHVYPTRIVSYDGKGDSLMKTVKYPQDMVNAGLDPTGIYAAMVSANIISPVIQFTQSKNGTQLMQSLTTYSKANPDSIINPQKVSLQVMANPPENRLNYQSYDSQGNLLTVAKANGVNVSYIWGYNGQYPVAEVKNSLASNIFFESFEDGNGNTGDSKTGRYAHVGNYIHALSGLSSSTYRLTYWQKSGSVWTLKDTTFTVSGTTYTISLNAQVDDIRFYPAKGQMTTYTYDPLIGVTSTTDAKGEITYYEYDSMQRLLNIRDQNKNIIKSFCYNYAGQVSNCYIDLPSYKSAAVSLTFNKNNCSVGYGGSTVTYNIPAGTYTSNISQQAADSLAAADAAAYGQSYANANGTCAQLINFTLHNTTGATSIQLTFSGTFGSYYYTMPNAVNGAILVPAGTYSLTVQDTNFNPHTITLGSRTAQHSPAYTFTLVNISTGSSDLTLTVN